MLSISAASLPLDVFQKGCLVSFSAVKTGGVSLASSWGRKGAEIRGT